MNRVACSMLALVLSAALLAGCKGPDLVMAPNTAAQDPLPAGAYPQIVLHDELQLALVKERPDIRPATDTMPMKVRVPLRSVVDRTTNVQYRFVFYNAAGDQVNRNPTWRSLSFPPRTRRFVEANSIALDAVEWELEVRSRY